LAKRQHPTFVVATSVPKSFILILPKLGLTGKYELRDAWRQKGLGVFSGKFETNIRHHGVAMLKLIAK